MSHLPPATLDTDPRNRLGGGLLVLFIIQKLFASTNNKKSP